MRAGAALATAIVLLGAAAPAQAQDPTCSGDVGSLPEPKAGAEPLTFGIYPGGQAGQVFGPPAEPRPEGQADIDRPLQTLRGDRRLGDQPAVDLERRLGRVVVAGDP